MSRASFCLLSELKAGIGVSIGTSSSLNLILLGRTGSLETGGREGGFRIRLVVEEKEKGPGFLLLKIEVILEVKSEFWLE